MNNRQKTPRGHPDFNSYMNVLRVLVFITDRRQSDRRTDRRTETLIRCRLPSLRSSRYTRCAWAGGNLRSKSSLFHIPDRLTDRQTDGDANFNSYIQNLRVFIFQMDERTNWKTEKSIRCGLGNLLVPPGTPAARGLKELYVQNLRCFEFQTDGQTDGQTEMLISIPTFKI